MIEIPPVPQTTTAVNLFTPAAILGAARQCRLDPSHPAALGARPEIAGVEPERRCPQGVPARFRATITVNDRDGATAGEPHDSHGASRLA